MTEEKQHKKLLIKKSNLIVLQQCQNKVRFKEMVLVSYENFCKSFAKQWWCLFSGAAKASSGVSSVENTFCLLNNVVKVLIQYCNPFLLSLQPLILPFFFHRSLMRVPNMLSGKRESLNF